MHSLKRSLHTTCHHPLLLSFFFLLLFLLETTRAAVVPHTIPITRLRRLQESAFDINININTPSLPSSLRIRIREDHHDKLTNTNEKSNNKMTKHSLLDLVTTNLGINLHTSSSSSPPSDAQYGPPPPKFHISSKDNFVHPLPGTYPRMTTLSDGSILFAFTHFEENGPAGAPAQRSLKIARSLDGGKTFTPHGEVTTSVGDTDNLFLLQLPWTVPVRSPSSSSSSYGSGEDGNRYGEQQSHSQVQPILAAFRNHDFAGGGNGTGYTHHRITICQSLDNGRRWEFLSQAVESSPPRGLWEPFMRMSKFRENEIQLFYSGELGADDQDTFLTVSRDGGRSWSKPYAVTGVGKTAVLGGQQTHGWNGPGKLRDGMIGIAETKDTTGREVLVMVLETTRVGGNFVVECLLSYDDGLSWGWRQGVYVPPAPVTRGGGGRRRNAGAPQVASFGDGKIAVVFMTDEDDDEVSNNRWPMGAKIKVLFGGRPDEKGRIIWRERGRPRDVSSSGTVLVEVGDANGAGVGDGRSGSASASGLAPAPAPGQDTSSLWPGVLRLDGERVLVVYETGGIIKGRVITQSSP